MATEKSSHRYPRLGDYNFDECELLKSALETKMTPERRCPSVTASTRWFKGVYKVDRLADPRIHSHYPVWTSKN